MKQQRKKGMAVFLVVLLSILSVLSTRVIVKADGFICNTKEKIIKEIKTSVSDTNSISELKKKENYYLYVDDKNRTAIFPIKITKAGQLDYFITTISKRNGIKGNATFAFYKDEEGKELVSESKRKALKLKSVNGNNNTMQGQCFFQEAGTYYLKVSISKDAKLVKNNTLFAFSFQSMVYSSENRTLADGKKRLTYGKEGKAVYYKITVKKSGGLKLNTDILARKKKNKAIKITLCDKNKEVLYKERTIKSEQSNTTYPVNKGIYYIRVQGEGLYHIEAECIKSNNKKNTKKSNAASIKVNSKKAVAGVLLEKDKNREDWYKFTLDKEQKITIRIQTSVLESASLQLQIIAPGNVKMAKNQFELSGNNKYTNIAGRFVKGTYYLKIAKTKKADSGFYTLQIMTK